MGLGDGPIDWTVKNQKFGTALESAVSTGFSSSPILGTAEFINRVPPLAIDKWVPPVGQDTIKPLFTVRDPYEVAAQGDHLFQTKEELQAYAGYNSKIPFESGMTKSRYDVLVELRTEQLRREAATTGRPFTNIFGQVIGGGLDPSNYIPVFGQLGNAWKLGKAARLGWNIVKSGSEGAVGSTLATAAISDRERAIGNDMSLRTYAETAALGLLIGATFGTVGHGIASALNNRTRSQAIASQTIVQSPITPQSAPDAVAVLADAYDSFMVNNGLATPFFAGGKGGPIQFGSHSQEAFTRGMQAAQKSVELNWANLVYSRKNEIDPLPVEQFKLRDNSREAKYDYLESIREKDPKGYTQLSKELEDYYTIEVDQRVVSRIIDDPIIKARFRGENSSRIKDATGRPITVFAGSSFGTNKPLSLEFSKKGTSSLNDNELSAIWTVDNPNVASTYTIPFHGKFQENFELGGGPNVRAVLLDIKNPLTKDMTGKGYIKKEINDILKEARDKGHDGVILTNLVDAKIGATPFKKMGIVNSSQRPSTHYAVFNDNQIMDLQSVSTGFSKVIDQQQAYLDARKGTQITQEGASVPAEEIPKGYNYDSQAASNLIINDVVTNKFIDVLPLIKAAEKNDEVKYQEVSNKAADLDLEAKTTGFEDEMELALARVPIRPEEEAFALKVDQDIAVADKLEIFINAAIKCMGVV